MEFVNTIYVDTIIKKKRSTKSNLVLLEVFSVKNIDEAKKDDIINYATCTQRIVILLCFGGEL